MDIKDCIAISGQPGLYKLVSQGKNILIAENLETGKRIPVHASSHVSSMGETAVFTQSEDMPLKDVFAEIYKQADGKAILDPKKSSNDQVKEYFASVLPSYDRDKVYVSDMKKILTWYNILVASGQIEDWTASESEEPKTEENL